MDDDQYWSVEQNEKLLPEEPEVRLKACFGLTAALQWGITSSCTSALPRTSRPLASAFAGLRVDAPMLPKTRSGKIMRRILRKIAENELTQLGDTSTLADPSVVDDLIANSPQTNA